MATTLVPPDTLAATMTWDPFCAQEGVKTLQSSTHFHHLLRIVCDLQLHLKESGLPYSLASDLLIRNIPLKEGVSPDVALWPGHLDLEGEEYRSLVLSADLYPALILEVVSEHTRDADADTKHKIYRLAGIAEYWLYDPATYAGSEPLCGWRLADSTYMPILGQEHAVDGAWVTRYPSTVLQTDWGLTADATLRLWDPQREDWYRTTAAALSQTRARAEQAEIRAQREWTRAEQAETRAQQEQARAEQAEAENVRLRALLQTRADPD